MVHIVHKTHRSQSTQVHIVQITNMAHGSQISAFKYSFYLE
jgi:hypothetical protein